MSLGLLGAYNSDSEASEPEEEKPSKTDEFKNPFIVSEDNDSSDEDSVSESRPRESDSKTSGQEVQPISNPFLNGGVASSNWLPKPSFMQETEKVQGLRFESSVFSNTFRAREDKKEAILTQHVGVTVKPESGTMFNGKKVCYNFRKGRCRHGHKCKFAHDNDVSSAVTENLYSAKYDEDAQISSDKAVSRTLAPVPMVGSQDVTEDGGGGSEATISSGKKKRPGLSDGLVPSKKAMKFHNKVYN